MILVPSEYSDGSRFSPFSSIDSTEAVIASIKVSAPSVLQVNVTVET